MKKLIYACTSIALVALVGLASCKKDNDKSGSFKLNSTSEELEVGSDFILKAKNYSGEVVFTLEPADSKVVTLIPTNGSEAKVVGAAVGEVDVVATNGGKVAKCHFTVTSAKEPIPEITLPGADRVTIAVRVPAGVTCNGVRGAGNFNDYNDNDATQDFTLVGKTATWYAMTYTAADVEWFKLLGISKDGKSSWSNQWSAEDGDVTILNELDGCEIDYSENGQPRLHIIDAAKVSNAVIYIDVNAWATDPCEPVNPAGKATFSVKLAVDNVKGAKVVGSWDRESEYGNWAPDKGMALTEADGSWTASVDVPEGFEFKILLDLSGEGSYTWDSPCLAKNQKMALDLNFAKEYSLEDWQNLPVE